MSWRKPFKTLHLLDNSFKRLIIMGQAKNRGSFEERKAKAIIKNQKEQDRLKQERESAKAERERNMTKDKVINH